MFRENPDNDDSDTQYRRELLKFFILDQYDDTKIGIRTDKLYHELVKSTQFVTLFTLVLSEPMMSFIFDASEISSGCLSMLCSFNYFHMLFNSIKEFKENKIISEKTFMEFKDEIAQNLKQ